jgi:cytochrome d ubiquinol oxidase subunit II
VSKADAAAAILWVGATFYALFGGADFGGGVWDLIAGGPEKGERPRALIQHSLTPVWEANHVWLIFVLVVLWTAFPPAFSAIFSTLYVPLALAALGIVLRGAGFAFRKMIVGLEGRRTAGAIFALSSLLTPFFMGTVVGAIVSGNVPADGNGDPFSSWIEPLPLLIGGMFVATSAYLAAVFLVGDARHEKEAGGGWAAGEGGAGAEEPDLERYFERRALAAALLAGAFAVAGIVDLRVEARYAYDRLTDQALPLVLLSAVCGTALLVALVRGARRPLRPLAAGAVVGVIWAWGVAQFPYLLPTSMRIDEAAAPGPTLSAVLVVFAAAVLVVLPSLALLYTLSQREIVGE